MDQIICAYLSHTHFWYEVDMLEVPAVNMQTYERRYFQHAHFIPKVGVGKIGAYYLVHGDLLRQHSFGTTLRFTGPVLANSRQ